MNFIFFVFNTPKVCSCIYGGFKGALKRSLKGVLKGFREA